MTRASILTCCQILLNQAVTKYLLPKYTINIVWTFKLVQLLSGQYKEKSARVKLNSLFHLRIISIELPEISILISLLFWFFVCVFCLC